MVEGIQYGGGISSVKWKIFSIDVSHHQVVEEVHHQYSGAYAVWTSQEGVQYMATKTAQGVVGGCIYLGK